MRFISEKVSGSRGFPLIGKSPKKFQVQALWTLVRSKLMAFATKGGSIVSFLVAVTYQAGLPGSDAPCVGCMAFSAWNDSMVLYPMESSESVVAGPAIHKRLDFLFSEMACATA